MGMIRMSENIDDLIDSKEEVLPEIFMTEISPAGRLHEVYLKRKNALYARLEMLDFGEQPSVWHE